MENIFNLVPSVLSGEISDPQTSIEELYVLMAQLAVYRDNIRNGIFDPVEPRCPKPLPFQSEPYIMRIWYWLTETIKIHVTETWKKGPPRTIDGVEYPSKPGDEIAPFSGSWKWGNILTDLWRMLTKMRN
jgi:hypothetical protein